MKDPQTYYDDFSQTYDDARGHGYHAHLDDLEADCVRHWLPGPRVLEVGCGTGLLLERVREFAPDVVGVDLSHGMIRRARERGHHVSQASATQLPFPDRWFDLVYSFKVLPHIPDLPGAIAEIMRVLDDDGVALLEFYNTRSIRGLWKRMRWWSVRIGTGSHDRQVFTEYHSPGQAQAMVPPPHRVIGDCGIVIATPHPLTHRIPLVAPVLRWMEHRMARGPLARFGGFYIVVAKKTGATGPAA